MNKILYYSLVSILSLCFMASCDSDEEEEKWYFAKYYLFPLDDSLLEVSGERDSLSIKAYSPFFVEWLSFGEQVVGFDAYEHPESSFIVNSCHEEPLNDTIHREGIYKWIHFSVTEDSVLKVVVDKNDADTIRSMTIKASPILGSYYFDSYIIVRQAAGKR